MDDKNAGLAVLLCLLLLGTVLIPGCTTETRGPGTGPGAPLISPPGIPEPPPATVPVPGSIAVPGYPPGDCEGIP